MDSLLTFFIEKWPYAVWIIIGGVIVTFYFKIKNRADNAHTRMDNLPCKAHDDLLVKLDDKLDMQNEKIHEIKTLNDKLDLIIQKLPGFPVGVGKSAIIKSSSPVSLSDYGKQLVVELNMENYISDNWRTISNNIEENSKSLNPYDIQQFCINYVLVKPDEVLSIAGNESVKSKAFKLGMESSDLLQAAAIIIRDRFFKEHNIDISELDKYES